MKNLEEKKDTLSIMINVCSRVVTLIFIAITIYMIVSNKADKVRFTLKDISGILFMGIISGLTTVIFCLRKKPTKLVNLIMQIVQFVILNISLLVISLKLEWFEKNTSSLVTMEIMFVVVYFVTYSFLYLFDFNETKKINQKLKDRRKGVNS
ncbi:MAG: DUF3021 family protein [Treponema sp.]|nr:DUF3021 family protein [Treponema sp.]